MDNVALGADFYEQGNWSYDPVEHKVSFEFTLAPGNDTFNLSNPVVSTYEWVDLELTDEDLLKVRSVYTQNAFPFPIEKQRIFRKE